MIQERRHKIQVEDGKGPFKKNFIKTNCQTLPIAVVVAQLVPTPEIGGSNPDIGNEIFESNYMSIAIQNRRNKEKEAGNGPIRKKLFPF